MPKEPSLNVVFCSTNSPKLKNSSFIVRNYNKKQQIFTFKKLELEKFNFIGSFILLSDFSCIVYIAASSQS